jgi:hypothetical protein
MDLKVENAGLEVRDIIERIYNVSDEVERV